ncbi:MAG: hypothetical protein QXH30_00065 [Candidatus Bilamarchaeaceae archaeon]
MAKMGERSEVGGVAPTVKMEKGALPAEPKAEGPAGKPGPRRVLGLAIEVLPSKEEGNGGFAFCNAEGYASLEKKPLRTILGRALGNGWVRFGAVAGIIAAPFFQLWEKGIGLYSYLSQQAHNFSSIAGGIYEHSTAILLSAAAAVTTIGLSIPFLSTKEREDRIRENEQEHPDEGVRKAHKSARRWGDLYRMASKFRYAAFLAALPLTASDFWAYANSGFKGTKEFLMGMSAPAQAAVGAFIALFAFSAYAGRKAATKGIAAAGASYMFNARALEKEEAERKKAAEAESAEAAAALCACGKAIAEENARASSAAKSAGSSPESLGIEGEEGGPEEIMHSAQPPSGGEEKEMQRLCLLIEQLRAEARVLAEKLGLALAAKEAIEKRMLSHEAAENTASQNERLANALEKKSKEAEALSARISELEAKAASLQSEIDSLLREQENLKQSAVQTSRLYSLAMDFLEKRCREISMLKGKLEAANAAGESPASLDQIYEELYPDAEQSPQPASGLRGSPEEGLPPTVAGSPPSRDSPEPDDYDPKGPAVSI